jgi:hypothetical protein
MRLNDGKVLVAGGEGAAGYLAGAELYEPPTGRNPMPWLMILLLGD